MTVQAPLVSESHVAEWLSGAFPLLLRRPCATHIVSIVANQISSAMKISKNTILGLLVLAVACATSQASIGRRELQTKTSKSTDTGGVSEPAPAGAGAAVPSPVSAGTGAAEGSGAAKSKGFFVSGLLSTES